MLDWIVQNKQWIFSGAGIAILGGLWWVFKKLFHAEPKVSAAAANNNSVIQSPTINVAPVINVLHRAPPPREPKPEAAPTPNKEEIDARPKLYTLPPRIINVTFKNVGEDDAGLDVDETGILEGRDSVL